MIALNKINIFNIGNNKMIGANKISFNGNWKYRTDVKRSGEQEKWYDPELIKKRWDTLPNCKLPACWNTIEEGGTLPFDRYEGVFWFFYQFALEGIEKDCDYYISFKGVNYYCKVWVNGTCLGEHHGGFLPFSLPIPTTLLSENNVITVEVENFRKFDRIPSLQFDWYNWGGIYRDVDLLVLSKKRIEWLHIITTEITPNSATLLIKYRVTHEGVMKWKIMKNSKIIMENNIEFQQREGQFSLKVPTPELWSPESPILYEFEIQFADGRGSLSTKFGIRTIEVKQVGIYLNKKLIKIRGVSQHEELMPYGRTIPEEERLKDLKTMKSWGFNTLRTAHYSHDEKLVALADEVGMLILEEIPVYWYCDFRNPHVLKLALTMVKHLIYRDFNHPSVILWSMGNEIPVENRVCYQFMLQLMQTAKKLDSSRIVTYVSSRMVSDELRPKSDLPCLNEYWGWYYFSERNLNRVLDFIHQTAPHKPLLITEFGADAKYGFHSNKFRKFSEEKQVSILSESIRTFNSKDYIAGWIIWIYRDFRSPMRLNAYQQGFNRKGIVSDKNEPKLITRTVKGLLWEKPKKRRLKFLTRYYFFIKPVELLIFGVFFGPFQNLFLKKKFEKYYMHELCGADR